MADPAYSQHVCITSADFKFRFIFCHITSSKDQMMWRYKALYELVTGWREDIREEIGHWDVTMIYFNTNLEQTNGLAHDSALTKIHHTGCVRGKNRQRHLQHQLQPLVAVVVLQLREVSLAPVILVEGIHDGDNGLLGAELGQLGGQLCVAVVAGQAGQRVLGCSTFNLEKGAGK